MKKLKETQMKLLEYLLDKDYVCREAKTPAAAYNVSVQGAINKVKPQEYAELLALIYDTKLEKLHTTRKGGISQKNPYIFNGYIDKNNVLCISYCFKVWRFMVG